MADVKKAPPLQSWGQVKELNNAYDEELNTANEQGRFVGFTTGMFPIELYEAFGVTKIQGEWYGSRCAFSQDIEFLETAETCGFQHELCSYTRMTLGSMICNRGFGGSVFPRPNLIVGMEGFCNMHVKWMENMARYLDVPMFVMDAPNLYFPPLPHWGTDSEKEAVEYFVRQEYKFIDFAEQVLGVKVSEEKLVKACATSRIVRDLFDDVLELAYQVPSPVSMRALFTYENCIISLTCKEETVGVLQSLKDELTERVKMGIPGIPGERVRLHWYGQPPWYDLNVIRYFESLGATFAACQYLEFFCTAYWVKLLKGKVSDWLLDWTWSDPANLHEALECLAKHTVSTFLRPRLGSIIDGCARIVREAKLDGTVWHYVRGCKGLSIFQPSLKNAIQKTLGVPGMVIEGSPADPRDYSADQVRHNIDVFLEKILAGKA